MLAHVRTALLCACPSTTWWRSQYRLVGALHFAESVGAQEHDALHFAASAVAQEHGARGAAGAPAPLFGRSDVMPSS